MKYVALLSGGKDSCFNLLHCHRNGHHLVAAASLGPGQGKEELDSYMYQTVGQDAIELVAKALDVPLYRRIIGGTAKEQGTEYGDRITTTGVSGDETEDLYELLSTVKTHHPDIAGVSVGAILSNYQRVRVEHVCRRLSLVPLCYLWRRSQAELLDEMIAAGMHVVLIKVAGLGLTRHHLGKTLSEMKDTLFTLNEKYGSHICGEGGEYESLTLDCPLFKSQIILEETEVVTHSDSGFASVAYLRVKNASVVPKGKLSLNVQIPPLLDDLHKISDTATDDRFVPTPAPETPNKKDQPPVLPPSVIKHGFWVSTANIQAPHIDQTISVSDEVTTCFTLLQDLLSRYKLDLMHCAHVNVYLSSMEHFTEINAIYATHFGTSPPARACIAVDLPGDNRVKLDCVAYSGPSRHALHVQSLSYWAPANIGPYSQAIMAGERVFVAGQIGMIPCDLSLPSPRSLKLETALSSQHADRIVEALKETTGGWHGHCQAVIYWLSDSQYYPTTRDAHVAYEKVMSPDVHIPAIFAAVKSLPKGALVEKQMLLHTGRFTVIDDGEEVIEDKLPSRVWGGSGKWKDFWEYSRFEKTNVLSNALVWGVEAGSADETIDRLDSSFSNSRIWGFKDLPLSIRIFHLPTQAINATKLVGKIFNKHPGNPLPITTIPCRFLATRQQESCDIVICILTF